MQLCLSLLQRPHSFKSGNSHTELSFPLTLLLTTVFLYVFLHRIEVQWLFSVWEEFFGIISEILTVVFPSLPIAVCGNFKLPLFTRQTCSAVYHFTVAPCILILIMHFHDHLFRPSIQPQQKSLQSPVRWVS